MMTQEYLVHEQQSPSEMAALIERFTGSDGVHSTEIAPLRLFRASVPSKPIPSVYEPALCLIAQGRKRVLLAEESYPYDPAHYLLVTVDLPVVGQVIEATRRTPYLGLRLRIDFEQISALIAETDLLERHGRDSRLAARGVSVGCLDALLRDAIVRLLRLLETPQHLGVLAPMVTREIWYLLLAGEQGARLRRIALAGGIQDIAQAICLLRKSFDEPLRADALAAQLHLSPSAFHRRFKAITAMTPLQYQKLLRLQEARRLMLVEAEDAAAAGYRVGYESASQFNREYRRLFGDSPGRDIARLRNTDLTDKAASSTG